MTEISTVGGHPVLDLVNTTTWHVPEGAPVWVEHLGTPADLLRWAEELDLVDAATAGAVDRSWRTDPAAGRAALRATHDVREAAHRILAAGPDPADARAMLHRRWSAAVRRAVLTPTSSGGGVLDVAAGPDPASLIPDRLALAAVDLLRTVDPRQVKQCPLDEGGCGWLFLDRSRNGSRRWCSMRDCGTHVKSQRLTARRRAARTSVPY